MNPTELNAAMARALAGLPAKNTRRETLTLQPTPAMTKQAHAELASAKGCWTGQDVISTAIRFAAEGHPMTPKQHRVFHAYFEGEDE